MEVKIRANKVITLGRLLREAREAKGLTRAGLSADTGLSENSIVRYEKAGVDGSGLVPPANKLWRLCRRLEIDEADALYASASQLDFDQTSEVADANDEGPESRTFAPAYFIEQFKELLFDNHILRDFVRYLRAPKPEPGTTESTRYDQAVQAVDMVIGRMRQYQRHLIEIGCAFPFEIDAPYSGRMFEYQQALQRKTLPIHRPQSLSDVTWARMLEDLHSTRSDLAAEIEFTDKAIRELESR